MSLIPLFLQEVLNVFKTKTRLVQYEDDRRVAVPPQFVFHHQGHEGAQRGKNALCDWLAPAYAVTGIPVTVYLAVAFLRYEIQTTSALFSCGNFHHGPDNRFPSLADLSTRTPSE
jgi:hypothetical protein